MSLKHEDLKGTVLPIISLDEFEPKAGNEENVIVVAFYLNDEDPAKDLNTFIQRGPIDTLDVEVSPNTDENGRYLVFVEMTRNETFKEKFLALVKDVGNVAGKLDWMVKTYYSGDKEFPIDDESLFKYVIIEPEEYMPKDEFNMNKMNEDIQQFFQNSLINNLTIDGNNIILKQYNKTIIAEVVDVGDYDDVIGRNFLAESAFKMNDLPYEVKVLQNMIGNYQVLPIEDYLCLSNNDKVMLLNNTQLSY